MEEKDVSKQYSFNEIVNQIDKSGISTTCKTINKYYQIIYHQYHSSSTANLEKIVKEDVSFSTEVLKVANSSLFKSISDSEITDISKAINLIGWDIVHKIGMTLSIKGLIKSIKARTFAAWLINRSVDVANISEIFLESLKNTNHKLADINSIYAYGLLHDIGSLGLLQVIPDYQKDVMSIKLENNDRTWSDAEEYLYHFNHNSVGEEILLRSQLPNSFSIIAKYHHSPDPKRYTEQDSIILTLIRLAQAALIDNHKFSEHNAFSDFTVNIEDSRRFREFHEFSFSLQSEFERVLGLNETIYNDIKTRHLDANFSHETSESIVTQA